MNKKDADYCRSCVYSERYYYNGKQDEICCMYLCITGEMRKSPPGYGCSCKKTGKRITRYADGMPRGKHMYYKNNIRTL